MKVKYEFDLADENDKNDYNLTLSAHRMLRALREFFEAARTASKHDDVEAFRRFQYKELVEAEIPSDEQLVSSIEMVRDFLHDALAEDIEF